MENRDCRAREEKMANVVSVVRTDRMVASDSRVFTEVEASMDIKARRDRMDLQDHPVPQAKLF